MQTDPTAPPQGGEGSGEGATGDPNPAAQLEAVKADNAKLREENRRLHADGLGAKHGLTPTQVELIAAHPKDKQEELATKLAAEVKGQQAPTPPQQPEGQPAEPAAPVSEQPPPPESSDLDPMADGGTTPPPTPEGSGGGWEAELQKQIDQAVLDGDFNKIQEIQAQGRARARQEAEEQGRVP